MISHGLDGCFEAIVSAIVEPGTCLRDVPQARDAEHHAVLFLLGDFEPPAVFLIRVGLDEAKLLEARAANARAAVTRRAAVLDKLGQTCAFLVGKRSLVAVQVLVETRRRHESSFESADGFGHVVVGDAFFLVGIGERGFEGFFVAFHRSEQVDDGLFVLHGHLDRIQDRAFGLVFERCCSTIPELRAEQASVVNRGRVTSAELSFVALGNFGSIDAELVEQVARIAGDVLVFGQARIEVEHPSESNFRVRDRVCLGLELGRQSAESLLCIGHVEVSERRCGLLGFGALLLLGVASRSPQPVAPASKPAEIKLADNTIRRRIGDESPRSVAYWFRQTGQSSDGRFRRRR
jgi:hypothetical protein